MFHSCDLELPEERIITELYQNYFLLDHKQIEVICPKIHLPNFFLVWNTECSKT